MAKGLADERFGSRAVGSAKKVWWTALAAVGCCLAGGAGWCGGTVGSGSGTGGDGAWSEPVPAVDGVGVVAVDGVCGAVGVGVVDDGASVDVRGCGVAAERPWRCVVGWPQRRYRVVHPGEYGRQQLYGDGVLRGRLGGRGLGVGDGAAAAGQYL